MTGPGRRVVLAVLFTGTVVGANVLTSHYGMVPAGFGLLVAAGTYTAGLALGIRDALHDAAGTRWVLAAIAVGAALSWVLGDDRIAAASGVAFAVAEILDLMVYVPLRDRQWHLAVAASNTVGAFADTALFLAIAGFSLTWSAVGGQLLVKAVWAVSRAAPGQRVQRADS